MSSTRRKVLRKPVVVNVGCGCRRPKLMNVFSPKPKSKLSTYQTTDGHNSSSSSWERSRLSVADFDDNSTTTFSPSTDKSPAHCEYSTPVSGFGRIGESVAVVKDSNDPYLDFQHSILQMIVEKEIYAKEDLNQLLHCLLSLNSPYHHDIIIRAFSEIWNAVFSAPRPRLRLWSRELQGFTRAKSTWPIDSHV